MRLFQDKGTVDELGIGTVRDALADFLFPGISTIQTRARYFLFVPWVHLSLESDKISSSKAENVARQREVALIKALLESDDLEGVIGRESGAQLQRLPSEIYWSGLQTLGIRRFQGSRAHYYRSLNDFYRAHDSRRANAVDGISEALAHQVNWHESLPLLPPEFPGIAHLALTQTEADYMRQQILSNAPGSMLAFVVDHPEWESVDYPWLHPYATEADQQLRRVLSDARNFSLIMHGAALLYNLLMSQKRAQAFGETSEQFSPDKYHDAFSDWNERILARLGELQSWALDLNVFWQTVYTINPRIHPFTRQFIHEWFALALHGETAALAGNDSARDLILKREKRMKGSRARLSNPRALELWGGESGTSRLAYRWPQAQTIATDILRGLARDA